MLRPYLRLCTQGSFLMGLIWCTGKDWSRLASLDLFFQILLHPFLYFQTIFYLCFCILLKQFLVSLIQSNPNSTCSVNLCRLYYFIVHFFYVVTARVVSFLEYNCDCLKSFNDNCLSCLLLGPVFTNLISVSLLCCRMTCWTYLLLLLCSRETPYLSALVFLTFQ